MIRTCLAALALTVLLATSACSGGTSSRPSAEAISSALQSKASGALGVASGTLSKQTADCFANVLHDSDVSSRALRALMRGETNLTETDKKALLAVVSKLEACKSKATPGS